MSAPCAAHDCSNALRWALEFRTDDGDLLRYYYICIAALRNSMGLLTECLSEWITLRLSFSKPLCAVDLANKRALWNALGVDPETAEMLTETLEFRFEGGRIFVSRACQHNTDLVDFVSCCLMSVWKFVRFTATRFLSVGLSSRTLIAGLFTGLENLVDYPRKEEMESLYFLNLGFALQISL